MRTGADFSDLLTGHFDSQWYQDLANDGYDTAIPVEPDGTLVQTELAFSDCFPG
ncbi:MAG TPA: hypothetical protein VF065_09665 [Ilumatobacter sp.]